MTTPMSDLDIFCEDGRTIRQELEWIGDQYDDSQNRSTLAMRCYEMACTARACLESVSVAMEGRAK